MSKAYHEFCYWPRWFYVLLLALFLGVPVGVFATAPAGEAWLALLPIPILALVLAIFFRLEIQIDAAGVAFGFPTARKRLRPEQIQSLEPEDYRFSRYLGWGWRIGGVRDRGYTVLGYRRGVRIRYTDEKSRDCTVFLSCSDPEAACRAANWRR